MGFTIWRFCVQKLQNILQHLQDQATHQEMEVDPHEEIARLRAQVAELQGGRGSQEEESFRSKKARIGGSSTDGQVLTLINSADSTLREAGRAPPLIRTRYGLKGIRVVLECPDVVEWDPVLIAP